MTTYTYSIDFSVRDYECDIQGIVNNAVYQNYLEHSRHEYLKSIGINFAELAQEGINLVVIRVELDYRYPLISGDAFTVRLRMERMSPLKIAFYQDIFRLSDNRLILQGKIIGTALNKKGRPEMPEVLNNLFSVQPSTVTNTV
jgi:acyl-CoA thioester hydrolase